MHVDWKKQFGVNVCPFSSACGVAFFYESPSHREAMSALRAVRRHPPGIALLIGDPGSGKTACLNRLAAHAEPDTKIFRWVQPHEGDENPHVATLVTGMSDNASRVPFDVCCGELLLNKSNAALIVDNADALSESDWRALESVVTHSTFLQSRVAVLIAGTPGVRRMLLSEKAEKIRSRIDRATTLEAFTHAQTTAYLIQRMQAAGCRRAVFTDEAMLALHVAAQGIPGAINRIALQALELATERDRSEVLPADIIAVQSILRTPSSLSKHPAHEVPQVQKSSSVGHSEAISASSQASPDGSAVRPSPSPSHPKKLIRYVDDSATSRSDQTKREKLGSVSAPPSQKTQVQLDRLTRLENQLLAALTKVQTARAALLDAESHAASPSRVDFVDPASAPRWLPDEVKRANPQLAETHQ